MNFAFTATSLAAGMLATKRCPTERECAGDGDSPREVGPLCYSITSTVHTLPIHLRIQIPPLAPSPRAGVPNISSFWHCKMNLRPSSFSTTLP